MDSVSIIVEAAKFFVAIYDKTTPSIRFIYIFWLLFIELYIFASALEKYNGLIKDRTLKIRNYHGTLYIFGGLSMILHHGSQMYGWHFLIEVVEGNNANALAILGFMAMLSGLYFVGAARSVLNGHWGPHIYRYHCENHNILKTSGIFVYTRHPVFFGQILMTIGTFMLSNNWWIIIFPISTVLLNLWRARREEFELLERFGNVFVEYKNKTSFIIPFI